MEKNIMEFVLKNAWILFIAVTFINWIIRKVRSQKYIKENPELKTGYEKLLSNWLIYGNIPWIIIGIGNIL